mmetsp:Transcript_8424/g.21034  ORF Transcript_8424/g.21034 Transcript_8424/m.21034 type:complete len:322 (+) Transcript_8424:505-1470(+)
MRTGACATGGTAIAAKGSATAGNATGAAAGAGAASKAAKGSTGAAGAGAGAGAGATGNAANGSSSAAAGGGATARAGGASAGAASAPNSRSMAGAAGAAGAATVSASQSMAAAAAELVWECCTESARDWPAGGVGTSSCPSRSVAELEAEGAAGAPPLEDPGGGASVGRLPVDDAGVTTPKAAAMAGLTLTSLSFLGPARALASGNRLADASMLMLPGTMCVLPAAAAAPAPDAPVVPWPRGLPNSSSIDPVALSCSILLRVASNGSSSVPAALRADAPADPNALLPTPPSPLLPVRLCPCLAPVLGESVALAPYPLLALP